MCRIKHIHAPILLPQSHSRGLFAFLPRGQRLGLKASPGVVVARARREADGERIPGSPGSLHSMPQDRQLAGVKLDGVQIVPHRQSSADSKRSQNVSGTSVGKPFVCVHLSGGVVVAALFRHAFCRQL